MAINKKVAAALKKVAKPKKRKSWSDSQNPPQSPVYKPENDKTVAAKPVGWRWTNEGAKRVGKNPKSKPSKAEIEKWKDKTFKIKGEEHRYVYDEKRADKSDVSRIDKFKKGGKIRKSWSDSQNPPQSTVYKPANDKTVGAKPVGYRWTNAGAARLGHNPDSKPSHADIEKYKDKEFYSKGVKHRYLYDEKRADKSDVSHRAKFARGGFVTNLNDCYASDELRKELATKMKEGDPIVCFAYTDYGGDFFDRVAIAYFEENYPDNTVVERTVYNGKNAIIFGEPAKEFLEVSENYLLGFDDMGDFYYEKVDEAETKAFEYFINDDLRDFSFDRDKVMSELRSKFGGYWGVLSSGDLDYSSDTMIEYLMDKNLIHRSNEDMDDEGKFKRGGSIFGGRYSSYPYNRASDADKTAKPVGYRFTDKLAHRLGVSVYKKPTPEQIHKYLGRGVYFENRQDKADANPSTKYQSLAHGGMMAKGGKIYSIEKNGYPFDWGTYTMDEAKEVINKQEKDGSYYRVVKYNEMRESLPAIDRMETPMLNEKSGEYIYSNSRPFSEGDLAEYSHGGMMAKGGMPHHEDDSHFERGGRPKIASRDSHSYTENMLPFYANNLEGKKLENGDYVVLSYGYYPIWFYSNAQGKWYGNKNKYSMTTAKQISHSRPTYDATIIPRAELEEVMMKSSLGKLHDEERMHEPNI